MAIELLCDKSISTVLLDLMWGDRFVEDLQSRARLSSDEFSKILKKLIDTGIVYQFRGERDTPYLSLTDKGISIAVRLSQIIRILDDEEV